MTDWKSRAKPLAAPNMPPIAMPAYEDPDNLAAIDVSQLIPSPQGSWRDRAQPFQAQEEDKVAEGGLTSLITGKQELQKAFDAKKGNDAGRISATVGGFNSVTPFGRKITSALGAGIADLAGAGNFKELYNQAEDDSQATAEAHPGYNIAGAGLGLANSLLLASAKPLFGTVAPTTGVRGAINSLPAALEAGGAWVTKPLLNSGTKLAKAANFGVETAKSALLGIPGGAIYGASEAKTGDELQGAKEGAIIGAGLGSALPAISSTLNKAGGLVSDTAKGIVSRNTDKLSEAGDALKMTSTRAYQKMRDIGATFKPEAVNKVVSYVETALKADGPLNQGLHGNTLSVLNDLKSAASRPDFSLEELDQYRRLLGRIPRSQPEDVRKASIVIDALDDGVSSISNGDLANGSKEAIDALTNARKAYSSYSKFDRISEVIKNSGGDANKLKSALQRLANNPKKIRGFTHDEYKALSEAAQNSTGEGLLKMAGKFGIDLGSSLSVGNAGLPAVYAAITGAVGGPGIGAATVAGGTLARQTQKWVARAKAEELLKVIENGGKLSAKSLKNVPLADARRLIAIQASSNLGTRS